MAATDFYSDTPSSPPTPDVEPTDSEPKKDEAGDSALLPKSLIGDVEPGDTVTLKIVHVYEDEVEVSKVSEDEGEEGEGEAEEAIGRMPMMTAND